MTSELWGVMYVAITASVVVAFASVGIPLIRYGLWLRKFRAENRTSRAAWYKEMKLGDSLYSQSVPVWHNGQVRCVRCQNWIPVDEAYGKAGAAFDPHVEAHRSIYSMLRSVEREENENFTHNP